MAEVVLAVGPDHPVVAAWRSDGHDLTTVADAADPTVLAPLVTDIIQRVGPPTVLVLVGPADSGPLSRRSAATLSDELGQVVGGGLVAAHQVLPAMRAAGHGRIQVVLDTATPDDPIQAALRALAWRLQAEEADAGIVVELLP